MKNNIEGKMVVITGASSGLGEATARLSWRVQPEDTTINEFTVGRRTNLGDE